MTADVFVLTPDHIKLLSKMWVGWQDAETGAPEIDPKRPYGNSDVAGDVAEILGVWTPSEEDDEMDEELCEHMLLLHRETEVALQIVLQHGLMQGEYTKPDHYSNVWVKS